MVLFGSSAPIFVDVNLILQYVTLVLLVVGYVKRKPFKTHGYIMLSVLLITVGTTLLVMAPRLFVTLSSYGYPIFAHAILGTITILLGALFSSRFILALRNNTPLKCGTKNWMRLTLILWIIPVLAGTMMYVTLYL
ncbi:MAG: hypothetical protein RTV31_05700 [Candidatus Thorarchaeota archaeon]